ncbi:MAG: hypothetical protein GXO11_03340 [Epsilonproteobacteria bacterium]|nr:hypothetical protein [Campylobacterota bacterium]
MTTNTALQAYKSHTLNITMKTSSGDVVKLDFENEKSLSYGSTKDENGSKSAMKLSSMQSFSFSVEGNGLDEQDKAEIEAFMEIAQPYIDNFLEELKQDAPKSPINKIAQEITDIFSPMKQKDQNTQNYAKNSIVEMFDKSLEETKATQEQFDKLFENAQKLLEKTLKLFDQDQKMLYA